MLKKMELKYGEENSELGIRLTDEAVEFVIDGCIATIDSAEFQDLMSLATLFFGLNH